MITRVPIAPDEIEHYDTGIAARALLPGMHILIDGDEPATIVVVITDDERRQTVVETTAVDGHRRRVLYLPYGEAVAAGVVRQYGVAAPGRPTHPIHPIHGADDSRRWARIYRTRHGGRIVARDVIPHAPTRGGDDYIVVTDWTDARLDDPPSSGN